MWVWVILYGVLGVAGVALIGWLGVSLWRRAQRLMTELEALEADLDANLARIPTTDS